jgi:hypothetical protein
MRIQWLPNVVRGERRICLTRIRWERGIVGDGQGYSCKLSLGVKFEPRDTYVGLAWFGGSSGWLAHVCVLPCLPLRVNFVKSYGGRFP